MSLLQLRSNGACPSSLVMTETAAPMSPGRGRDASLSISACGGGAFCPVFRALAPVPGRTVGIPMSQMGKLSLVKAHGHTGSHGWSVEE